MATARSISTSIIAPCLGTLTRRIRTTMGCSTRRRSNVCGEAPYGKGGAVHTAGETTPAWCELRCDRAADNALLVRRAGSWQLQIGPPAATEVRRLAFDAHDVTAQLPKATPTTLHKDRHIE